MRALRIRIPNTGIRYSFVNYRGRLHECLPVCVADEVVAEVVQDGIRSLPLLLSLLFHIVQPAQ
jgi:hypothetical protein